MLGLRKLARAQAAWKAERDGAIALSGRCVVLGDKKAGRLIAQGWTIDRTETALIGGTSSGVLLYHMKRDTPMDVGAGTSAQASA
jgi:hypothetical protein